MRVLYVVSVGLVQGFFVWELVFHFGIIYNRGFDGKILEIEYIDDTLTYECYILSKPTPHTKNFSLTLTFTARYFFCVSQLKNNSNNLAISFCSNK